MHTMTMLLTVHLSACASIAFGIAGCSPQHGGGTGTPPKA